MRPSAYESPKASLYCGCPSCCRLAGLPIWGFQVQSLPCSIGGSRLSQTPLPGCLTPSPWIVFIGAFGGIRTRVHTRPQGRESNKDSRPVRSTTDSYEGKDRRFELHRITCHGIGLPATVQVSTLTGVGGACPICRSDRTGLWPKGTMRILMDTSEGSNRSRFEPSNPLTILPCTLKSVKSRRVRRACHARRKACTTAAPCRFYRLAVSCRAFATSKSCSRCIGIRIRAAAPRTPPP